MILSNPAVQFEFTTLGLQQITAKLAKNYVDYCRTSNYVNFDFNIQGIKKLNKINRQRSHYPESYIVLIRSMKETR